MNRIIFDLFQENDLDINALPSVDDLNTLPSESASAVDFFRKQEGHDGPKSPT